MYEKEVRYDFTDGGIFSKKRTLSAIEKLFVSSFKLEFPWSKNKFEQIKSDNDLKEDETILFHTGTNHQIKDRISFYKMNDGEICECCGGKRKELPWEHSKFPFLCTKCANHMEQTYGDDIFGMKKKKKNIEYPWWLVP